jgi:hypothetical protein
MEIRKVVCLDSCSLYKHNIEQSFFDMMDDHFDRLLHVSAGWHGGSILVAMEIVIIWCLHFKW